MNDPLIQSLRQALRDYGQHPIGCPRWRGKISCTCGLDDVLESGNEYQLFDAIKRYGTHDIMCDARGGGAKRCTCLFDVVLLLMPSPKTRLVKIGPASITVEVEETLLHRCATCGKTEGYGCPIVCPPLKEEVQLPAARVVELWDWRPHLKRGFLSGLIIATGHALLHFWWGW